jgi:hypothetical protein
MHDYDLNGICRKCGVSQDSQFAEMAWNDCHSERDKKHDPTMQPRPEKRGITRRR